jgi:hypothetical protein
VLLDRRGIEPAIVVGEAIICFHSWYNAFQKSFGARRIPVLPKFMVRLLALTDDALSKLGIREVPFNSFRLKIC